jgi:hypothetical protein
MDDLTDKEFWFREGSLEKTSIQLAYEQDQSLVSFTARGKTKTRDAGGRTARAGKGQ